jgi:3'-phosphoadenosine 5'-phosphosulfate sulfotransferase (PAPS reductase)/FAD synthetase
VIHVICYSGGKDSTALWLWAQRMLVMPRVILFCDTGWEHPVTLGYIEQMGKWMGEPVVRVHGPETFEQRVRRLRGFPSSGRRWCTQELKIQPTAKYLDHIRDSECSDVEVLVGVRAEESRARAAMSEREWSDAYDCEVWRPLLNWTLADVVAEHKRAKIPMNPLYHMGAERVGCWPCINAGKEEIALVAETCPERIDLIRDMERETKNTMFAKEAPASQRDRDAKRTELPLPIDEAVKWARTDRGGRQIQLVRRPGGCARWGICEAAP